VALTALYDPRCPLCRRLKDWLSQQPTLAPIEFLPAAGPEARRRYPSLDHERTTRVLTVIAQHRACPDGGLAPVYEGERAWVVCAWALPGWQPVAERIGTPHRLPLVRVVARAVDAYRRHWIARAPGTDCDACQVASSRHV
jgi:predicted DCC family thiol-disulfide oxidoreductase YuxK